MRLIDADALCKHLHELKTGDKNTVYEYYDDGIDTAISEAATFPTIEAEPVKHGRWREYNYPGQECVYCSACKTEYYPDDLIVIGVNDYPYYCPNCGAKMDAEEGEDHD